MDIVIAMSGNPYFYSDAAFGDTVGRLFLQTWPDRIPVAAMVEADAASDGQRQARLVADGALDDRWYVVGSDPLPAHIVPETTMPDGTVGARFRPGSHPRVRQIGLCDKGSDKTALLIEFSEPILSSAAPGDLVSLAIAGRSVSCQPNGAVGESFELVCSDLTAASSVTVSISTGITGATGEPLSPGSWDINVTNPAAGPCRYFSPPI
jgi:hypothetical protein